MLSESAAEQNPPLFDLMASLTPRFSNGEESPPQSIADMMTTASNNNGEEQVELQARPEEEEVQEGENEVGTIDQNADGTFNVRVQVRRRMWFVGRFSTRSKALMASRKANLFLGRSQSEQAEQEDVRHHQVEINIPGWVKQIHDKAGADGNIVMHEPTCAPSALNGGGAQLYRGVYANQYQGVKCFLARVGFSHRTWTIGRYETELEAAVAYDIASHFLDYPVSRLNFPARPYSDIPSDEYPFEIPQWVSDQIAQDQEAKLHSQPSGESQQDSTDLSQNSDPKPKKKYRGVHQTSRISYGAQISVKYKPYKQWYIGYFQGPNAEEEAALAYDKASFFLGRKPSTFNFPDNVYSRNVEDLPFVVPDWVLEAISLGLEGHEAAPTRRKRPVRKGSAAAESQTTPSACNENYRGVTQVAAASFKASVRLRNRTWYIGTFHTAKEAALAFDQAYVYLGRTHPHSDKLNFPDGPCLTDLSSLPFPVPDWVQEVRGLISQTQGTLPRVKRARTNELE